MSKRLTDFSVLTFDCYGTLIDWESGIWDALQPLLAANASELKRRAELDTSGVRPSTAANATAS